MNASSAHVSEPQLAVCSCRGKPVAAEAFKHEDQWLAGSKPVLISLRCTVMLFSHGKIVDVFFAAVAFTLFCTNEGKQMGELAQQIKNVMLSRPLSPEVPRLIHYL